MSPDECPKSKKMDNSYKTLTKIISSFILKLK